MSKTISLIEFLGLCKVMRMNYGQDISTRFFEKNLEEFTGLSLPDLKTFLNKKNHPAIVSITGKNIDVKSE